MKKNKILVVLRHGEADFIAGGGADFKRELTENGRNQLLRLKELFVKTGLTVDKILSSSSKRTTQTTEIMSLSMDSSIIDYSDEIYEAEASELLTLLSQSENRHDCVLLVGHNPGVSALVSHIADQGYLNIQPGMMVIIELTVDDWSLLGVGTGIVKEVLQ